MDKLYTNISTFMDSRQKIAGMTGKFGVIPEFFYRESSFVPKYHVIKSHISCFAQQVI